jgi:hypothetical protein
MHSLSSSVNSEQRALHVSYVCIVLVAATTQKKREQLLKGVTIDEIVEQIRSTEPARQVKL